VFVLKETKLNFNNVMVLVAHLVMFMYLCSCNFRGCAMTGVVSHWHFTTGTWVLSQAVHVEFVADRLALSQVFLLLL